MASIYKRGKKWRGQITVDGKRYSFTADKRSDVVNWAASVQAKNIDPSVADYTVKEWMEIYFEDWYRPRVTESTYHNNVNLVRNHLYPVLGEVPIKDLTTTRIQEAYVEMFTRKETKKYKKCNYSDGTIKMFAIRFNKALSVAVEEGVIRKNPHSRVVVPKTGIVRKVEAYTAEEQAKIVEYTREQYGIDGVFYFLIATGMRVGECLALTWNDVNLKEGYVDITKTAVNLRGHMVIQDHPKTAQSIRRVYLAVNTIGFLRHLKESSDESSLLFHNMYGNIYHSSALRSRWVKVCAEIGIPYKNLHALRHSWATRALEQNIEVNTVSKMLGHKSVATTMDIYQSVFASQKREAAKLMNAVV